MTNGSNKDVITTSNSNNILPATRKCQMIQIKRMNDYAPLLHNGIFHRKTTTPYIQLVLHC